MKALHRRKGRGGTLSPRRSPSRARGLVTPRLHQRLRRADRRLQRFETGRRVAAPRPTPALAQRLDGAGSNQLDSWIAIAPTGT